MLSSIPFEYKQFSNRSIRLIEGTVISNTTSGHRQPGSNDNEGILPNSQIFGTEASSLDAD